MTWEQPQTICAVDGKKIAKLVAVINVIFEVIFGITVCPFEPYF